MIVEAGDFSKPVGQDSKSGLERREKLLGGIKKFLAAVEDGRALIQSVTVTATVECDEYEMQTLTFKYAEGPTTVNEIRKAKGFDSI